MVSTLRFASTVARTVSRTPVLPTLDSISASQLVQKPNSTDYFLKRTSNGNLPIYKTVRSQATWTDIKRVEGNIVSFRNDVQQALAASDIPFDEPNFFCIVQSNTLRIKGDYVKDLSKILDKYF